MVYYVKHSSFIHASAYKIVSFSLDDQSFCSFKIIHETFFSHNTESVKDWHDKKNGSESKKREFS